MATYIIKFTEEGRRSNTYLKQDFTEEQLQAKFAEGYEEVDEETYQILLGNTYGREYIKNPETGELEPYVRKYTADEISRIQSSIINGYASTLLDTTAKAYGYSNILDVCSYIDTGVQKYDDEGVSFRAWRSQVRAKTAEILEGVQASGDDLVAKQMGEDDGGEKQSPAEVNFGCPTYEEFTADMPELEVVYKTATEDEGTISPTN